MKAKRFTPILLLLTFIVLIGIACGSTPAAPTQPPPPPPPTNTPVPPPTETPLPPPTETPLPPPTETPPPPPPTNPPPAETSEAGSSLPVNCLASDTIGFMSCFDNTGGIVVDVPDYWSDVNGGEWFLEDESIGVAISAAPNLEDYANYYNAEGMFYGASNRFAQWGGYVEFLDIYTETYRGACDLVGRFDYNDTVYRGKYDQYEHCGGASGYDAYVLSAVDIVDPSAQIILLIIQTVPGDTATVQQAWNTFFVIEL